MVFGLQGGHNDEGRVMTLEFDEFFLVNCYSPNSKEALARLPYRMEFEDAMRTHLKELAEIKSVILCGDLNVAHQEIDLKNPKTNRKNAGFSDEERGKFTELLETGFLDSFRTLYPDLTDAYSWWSYRFQARTKNTGWRIDYFVLSEDLRGQLQQANIYNEVLGSDHCPVGILMNFKG